MSGYLGPGVTTQIDGYTQSQTDAKLTPTNVSDKNNASTGAFDLPSGTTAQRPASPNTGYTRYNTTIGAVETWNGTAWVTSGGLVLQAVQTANFTATAGNSYPVNTTSGGVTVTLPASPTAGQQVNVFDYAGTAATNAITINPNGLKINGVAGSAVVSTVRASVTLAYVDSTQGWVDVAVGNATYLPQNYSVDYLVVAGGGGGGGSNAVSTAGNGGGGGAGGVIAVASSVLMPTSSFSVTVGAGGAGQNGSSSNSSNGSNSVFSLSTSIGGGRGSSYGGFDGGSGGSGGGAGYGQTYGSGTSGQGYAGGAHAGNSTGPNFGCGAGGGAGGAGNPGTATAGGNGGAGYTWFDGTTRAGGGGGASYGGTAGTGTAGGGNGTSSGGATGGAGAANTGSGGGGGSASNSVAFGGNGGSGIVIIRYAGSQRATGGTVTSSGGYTYHTFTSSGTFTA